jgi:glutamate carboxypeptidase
MDAVLSYMRSRQAEVIGLIRDLVECESPSTEPEAVNRFVELVAGRVSSLARVRRFPGGEFGQHLLCEFELPGKNQEGQVLALGHSDTVWPLGSIQQMPFREVDGRLWGPGVLDMKAGLAMFVFAVEALRDLDLPVRRRVLLLLNSDEELGSDSSRPLTEEQARRSEAVLVLEPAAGLEGKLKTARKGTGDYTLTVHGKAAHAGLDFTEGASAILELARQIDKIARFTNLPRGITVNAGVISGGTRANVVAAEARAEINFRVPRLKDAAVLDRRFRSLRPFDRRCRLEVSGALNRPPMERTPAVARLFRLARGLAAELGVTLEESASGGGSDGNFTAALGVPTLDGLGAVGEGAHATHESILIDRIADRTALLAKLLLSM